MGKKKVAVKSDSASTPSPTEANVHGGTAAVHDTPEKQATALHLIPRDKGLVGSKQSKLDAPPARPGMTQRWVRVRLRDSQDRKNLDAAIRAGFRPRLADTVPEGLSPSTTELGGYSYVGVDDVVLMERPEDFEAKERAADAETRRLTMEAVYRQLQQAQQPGGPRIDVGRKTEVTRGKRRVVVKGDDVGDDDTFEEPQEGDETF